MEIDHVKFERLLPLAQAWAQAQEQFVLDRGASLGPRYLSDAKRVGVTNFERVRLLVVDRMPMPDDGELAEAARHTQIITESCRGIAIGYGIVIRADSWGNRELVVHQLVHVAQCERSGGLECWVREYLMDRQSSADFSVGMKEDEARRIAREICQADCETAAIATAPGSTR
jgi:hypothetical protein